MPKETAERIIDYPYTASARRGGSSSVGSGVGASAFLGLTDTPSTFAGADGYYVTVDESGGRLLFTALPAIPADFTDLGDVPSSYSGHSLKLVRVNAGETALEFFTSSGAGYTQEEIEDFVAAQFTGNTGIIDATYDDGTGAITLTLDVSAADRYLYSTGADAWAEGTITSYMRGLLDDADAATARTTLGVTVYDQETAEDVIGAMVSGNTETGISVTYDDGTGKLNFDAQTAGDVRYLQLTGGALSGDLIVNADLGISQASPQWPAHITGTSAGAKLVLLTLHNNSNDNSTEAALRFVNRNTSITSEAFRVGELSVQGLGGDGIARMIGRVSNGSSLMDAWWVHNLIFHHATPVGILLNDPQSPLSVVSLDATLSQNADQIELRSQRTTINAVGEGLVGGIGFRSDDTSVTAPGNIVARLQAIARETHTSLGMGTAMRIMTTPNGSLTPVQTGIFDQDGVLYIPGARVTPGTSSGDAAVGGVLYVTTTQTGNVGTGEDVLASYSVPANTLSSNLMSLTFEARGRFSSGATTRLRARFGTSGTNLIQDQIVTVGSGVDWVMRGTIIRTGAATQKGFTDLASIGMSYVSTQSNLALNQTLSGAVTLQITGEATNNNDVILDFFKVEWQDANT